MKTSPWVLAATLIAATPAWAQQAPGAESTADACHDGADNDADLHVDCDDQDCGDFTFCARPAAGTGGAPPAPTTVAGQGSRRLGVTADPPGTAVLLDAPALRGPFAPRPLWQRAPLTLEASQAMHSLTLHASGYEPASVSIPAGAEDLLIDVDMSRPVFEAGIALTVIGGVATILGIAIAAARADEETGFDVDDFGQLFGAIAGPGLACLVAGALMMGLDRQRAPTFTVRAATGP